MTTPADDAPAGTAATPTAPARGRGAALFVFAGILLSRILGLVRERIKAHYLGNAGAAGAFSAAFRIPNALQNLLGEGVLSASFIPVYAKLLAIGDEEEAGRVAGAIASILALVAAIVVATGVLTAPFLVDIITPGFRGDKRELTISLVRILFPGAGLFVMSAWCLGILNSHRRFFLSYAAPVVWNVAMIGALLVAGPRRNDAGVAVALAWGSLIGAALQFAVQLPTVLRLAPKLRLALDAHRETVREVIRNFIPVFVGRGVVQISAFVDAQLASFVRVGAVAAAASSLAARDAVSALSFAQILYTLPVSLFGMSVSAAELPSMSSVLGDTDEVARALRERLQRGLRQIAFFVVPSAAAFLVLGDVVASTLLRTGKFDASDATWLWGILAGSAIGLLASTLGRLYSSTYYALRDTRTPLRYAIIRVLLTAGLGAAAALLLPSWLGIDPKWGVAGLTASAGIAGWIEFALLRHTLNARIGATGLTVGYVAKLWGSALLASAIAFALKIEIGMARPALHGIAILALFGVVYFGATAALKVPEVRSVWRRLARRG